MLPVFRLDGANGLSIQKIGHDGHILGFDQIFPEAMRDVPVGTSIMVATGEPSLWGFTDRSGTAIFEQRQALEHRLRQALVEERDPFLQLQIARFCGAETELARAWSAAFSRLERRSPKSALAWRDMVVLPVAIRSIVAQIAADHDLEDAGLDLDEAVETLTRNDRLHLVMAPDLYRLFEDGSSAREQLEAQTLLIRRAFGLDTGRLLIRKLVRPFQEETLSRAAGISRYSIVTLGRMAEAVASNLFPRTVNNQAYLGVRPPGSPSPPDIVMVVRDYGVAQVAELPCDLEALDIGSADELFIMFELGIDHLYYVEVARDLATRYLARGMRVTAVIPHLPDHLFHAPGDGIDLPARLSEAFGAIWFLGDRSADVRQTLPYGPGRSPLAASRHLEFLLDHRTEWREDIPRPHGAEILVASSAAGARRVPVLLELAFSRLFHPEFALEDAYDLVVATGVAPERHQQVIEAFAERRFPQARLMLAPVMRVSGGHGEVVLAAKVPSMRAVSDRHFEEICARQFIDTGWRILESLDDGPGFVMVEGDERYEVECKRGPRLSGASGGDDDIQGWGRDNILVVAEPVRQKSFLRHVLNGRTIIHYSRIPALRSILRKRYAYALSALRRGQLDIGRDVLPACLSWLAAHDEINALLPGKARISLTTHEAAVNHRFGADFLSLELQLLISTRMERPISPTPPSTFPRSTDRRPLRASGPISATVKVVLLRNGWQVTDIVIP